MKDWLLTITFVTLNLIRGSGQDLPPTFRFNFSGGIQFHGAISSNGFNISQIVVTNHPDYCGGGPCIPYAYEKNLQGLGVSPGIGLQMAQIEVLFTPEFRYDEIYFSHDGNGWKSHKEFIFNPQLSVQRWFKKAKRPSYVGLGYKIVNTGKDFDFYDNIEGEDKNFSLQVPAGIAYYGRAIGQSLFFWEFQLYYFYRGLPHNPYGPYFMYGVYFYRKFGARKDDDRTAK